MTARRRAKVFGIPFTMLLPIFLFIFEALFPDPSIALSIGNLVQTTSPTNVRECSLTSCSIITEKPIGSRGQILNGPYAGSGYTWWYIKWEDNVLGYSVQNWLVSTPPATPTGLSPGSTSSPGPTQSSSTVTLSWDRVFGAEYYGVGVRDMVSGVLVVSTTTTGTSYPASLTPGGQYRWDVASCNNATGCVNRTTDRYFQTPPLTDTVTITSGPSGTPNPVASGGAVNLSAAATDSLNHPLSYFWVSVCNELPSNGSFNNPSTQSPIWTAPTNTTGTAKSCTLTVTVNDGLGHSDTKSFQETVNSLTADTVTITSGPSGTPNPVTSGGTVNLSAAATDSLNHPLSYFWVSVCNELPSNGSFNNPSTQSPIWTAPTNTTGTAKSCTLTVTVNDGLGHSDTKSFQETVNSENQQTGILSVSANKLIFAPGETIVFSGQVIQNGSPVQGVRITVTDPFHPVLQDVGSTDLLGHFSYNVPIPLQLSGRRITGIYTFAFSVPSLPGLKKYVTLSVRDKNEAPEAFIIRRPDISLALGSADTITGNTLALASNVAGTTPRVAPDDIIAANRVLLDEGKEFLHDFFTDPTTDLAIGVALASCPVPGPQTALCAMSISYIKLKAAESIAKVGVTNVLRQTLESFYPADANKKKDLEALVKSVNLGISVINFDPYGGLVGLLTDGLLPTLSLGYKVLDLEAEILERDASGQSLRAKMVLQPADPTKPILGISLRRKPPTGLWKRIFSFFPSLQPSQEIQMGVGQGDKVADQSISWQALGGLTPSKPEAAIDGQGTVYLIVRGAENGLYVNTERQGTWTGWTAIPGGGATGGGPAAVIDVDGTTLRVFVRGLDDHLLYENVLVGTQWMGWNQIPGGGLTPSSPTAAIDPNGTIYLFVRGLDNAIWYATKAGGAWSGWQAHPTGGLTPSELKILFVGSDLLLFVRGVDNKIYLNMRSGGTWSGWSEVPGDGQTTAGLAAVAQGLSVKLFIRGLDNRIYSNLRSGGTWSGWSEVPGNGLTQAAPAATVDSQGNVLLFVRGM